MAAAGIYALEHNVQRLAEDHANARLLAERLAQIEAVEVDPGSVQTNMVFMRVDPSRAEALRAYLKQRNVLIGAGSTVRLVTHLDVSAEEIGVAAQAVAQFFAEIPQPAAMHV